MISARDWDLKKEGKMEIVNKIARRMIQDGDSIDFIVKYTNLTREQVEELVKEVEEISYSR